MTGCIEKWFDPEGTVRRDREMLSVHGSVMLLLKDILTRVASEY